MYAQRQRHRCKPPSSPSLDSDRECTVQEQSTRCDDNRWAVHPTKGVQDFESDVGTARQAAVVEQDEDAMDNERLTNE